MQNLLIAGLVATLLNATPQVSNQVSNPNQDSWINPPTGALRREKPRAYTIGLNVDIATISRIIAEPNPVQSAGGAFFFDMSKKNAPPADCTGFGSAMIRLMVAMSTLRPMV